MLSLRMGPTPPATDEGSHDDAASSSSLSELDENADIDVSMQDFDEQENRRRFEDAARAGAEAEQHAQIKPHHFEGGIPVFQPTMDEFRGRHKHNSRDKTNSSQTFKHSWHKQMHMVCRAA